MKPLANLKATCRILLCLFVSLDEAEKEEDMWRKRAYRMIKFDTINNIKYVNDLYTRIYNELNIRDTQRIKRD